MNYNKYILSLILLLSITISLCSQNNFADKDSLLVYNTINKLFDGMREGDSAKVHSVFHKNVRMFTSYKSKTGEIVLEEGKLSGFLNAVGSPHQEIWNEKISNTSIKVDGRLAQVWTDYSFYVDDNFSHCGVDAFQLVKEKDDNWKIISLIDTRRKEGCDQ